MPFRQILDQYRQTAVDGCSLLALHHPVGPNLAGIERYAVTVIRLSVETVEVVKGMPGMGF